MTGPDEHLDATFSALADPTRRAIVARLLDGDMTVGALAEPFDLSLAAISKHLGILARAGLVTQRREGRAKYCRLEIASLRPAVIWMESFGHAAAEDFDALEAFLQGEGLLPAEDDQP